MVTPRAKNGSLTKIGVVWQKLNFWTENRDFWPKNPTFAMRPQIFDNGSFVALWETVHFPPWDRFFDFSFLSEGLFRKKKNLADASKSLPPPNSEGNQCNALWKHFKTRVNCDKSSRIREKYSCPFPKFVARNIHQPAAKDSGGGCAVVSYPARWSFSLYWDLCFDHHI